MVVNKKTRSRDKVEYESDLFESNKMVLFEESGSWFFSLLDRLIKFFLRLSQKTVSVASNE